VIADWSADGSVDRAYPQACYQDALGHLPVDVDWYSSAASDIRSAMVAAARRESAAEQASATPATPAKRTTRAVAPTSTRRLEAAAPEASAVRAQAQLTGRNDPTALPTPLLIAAAAAAFLLAHAAWSAIRRRRRIRATVEHPRDPDA
jgi:hypothetical protein